MLEVLPDMTEAFERAFAEAPGVISAAPGYIFHDLQRCIEKQSRYVLLVRWETLQDHTEGFRGSDAYAEWRRLLHHFYDPFPTAQHFEPVE